MKFKGKKFIALLLIISTIFIMVGCGSKKSDLYAFYSSVDNVVNVDIGEYVNSQQVPLLTENNVVYVTDDMLQADPNLNIKAAILVDITNNKLIHGQDIYKHIYPASITKLMTAYLLFKYGNMDEMYTIKEDNCGITEEGAQLVEFKKGDVVTVGDLAYCLLVYSGNDAAVAISEYIAGSEAAFVEKMNEEAHKIGLSDTHFTNPHGLHDKEHYTSAYDMYILFNKCMEFEHFRRVTQVLDYEVSIRQADGEYRIFSLSSTNQFKLGRYEVPEGLTILGGKTGNTVAAGPCLIQYFSDMDGNEYIAALFGAKTAGDLYNQMQYYMCKVSDKITLPKPSPTPSPTP